MTPSTPQGLRFRVPEGVHTRRFGEELVILDLSGGEYYALDELGARVWEELAGGGSVGDAVGRLTPGYDVLPSRLLSDLLALTEELVKRKLLVAL
jgi:Coenzyme PQQ synthesis protein D (PqqD)